MCGQVYRAPVSARPAFSPLRLRACCQLVYNEEEAKKYTERTRNTVVQRELTLRAVEMLNFPEKARRLVLDVGCGSGLSGGAWHLLTRTTTAAPLDFTCVIVVYDGQMCLRS